jgi:hypothetical protein
MSSYALIRTLLLFSCQHCWQRLSSNSLLINCLIGWLIGSIIEHAYACVRCRRIACLTAIEFGRKAFRAHTRPECAVIVTEVFRYAAPTVVCDYVPTACTGCLNTFMMYCVRHMCPSCLSFGLMCWAYILTYSTAGALALCNTQRVMEQTICRDPVWLTIPYIG